MGCWVELTLHVTMVPAQTLGLEHQQGMRTKTLQVTAVEGESLAHEDRGTGQNATILSGHITGYHIGIHAIHRRS